MITVSTSDGLSARFDLRELVDVDNDFKPVGDDPQEDWNARIVEAIIRGMFKNGYYDLYGSGLVQQDVSRMLQSVRISKPIRVLYPEVPGLSKESILVMRGSELVLVAEVGVNGDEVNLGGILRLNGGSGSCQRL